MTFLRLCMAAVIAFLWASTAHAYCFENKSDKWLHVEEVTTEGGKLLKFYGDVLPGKKLCCDWRDPLCNPDGKIDSPLNFVIYALPDKSGMSPGGWTFTLAAGGRIELKNTGNDEVPLECLLFNPGD